MSETALLTAPATMVPPRRTVLYLTHHLPWPAHSGGTVREYQLLSRLTAHFSIDLVAVEIGVRAWRRQAAGPQQLA